MKTLSTDAAAAALGVDRKSIDNILAREARSLLRAGTQGRSRRIPMAVLERVAIALVLHRDLEVGISRGLELAGRVLSSPKSPLVLGSLSTLEFNLPLLRETLDRATDDALESVAERTRGRPRA
jgi:hypothetical protein